VIELMKTKFSLTNLCLQLLIIHILALQLNCSSI